MTVEQCYCDDCQQAVLEILVASRILRLIEAQEVSIVHGRDDDDFGDDDFGDDEMDSEHERMVN